MKGGSMDERQETCEERVEAHLDGRIEALERLWAMHQEDPDAYDEDYGSLYDYGLCFDYVPLGTFHDQDEPYFRYQISWGGPSDEFRIFVGPDLEPYRIEYWFLDWWDGAHRVLHGDRRELLADIFCWIRESGACEHAMDNA
jgi:hypothetical protein